MRGRIYTSVLLFVRNYLGGKLVFRGLLDAENGVI
jgi:hypothetical protein